LILDMAARPLIALVLSTILLGCSIPKPLVERIKEKGVLLVATRNSPTTYYESRNGIRGMEYELVGRFARSIGVNARFIIPDTLEEILPLVADGEVDLAAAGLTVTPQREQRARFGPSYQKITQQLIYRGGSRRPKTIADTIGSSLEVVAGSVHEETLQQLKQKIPGLHWVAPKDTDSEELLYLVKEQMIDYTVADSNVVALSRRFYPELKVAFDLTKSLPLAWAFPHAEDSSLFNAARDFLEKLRNDGTLEQLIERYYGHTAKLGFVDTRSFRRHIATRLPALIPFFKKAAEETGIEWQLLAAIGYQESHWNPKAISPTGVRGVMMLTRGTARQLGVKDRRDPEQSILGGARYLRVVEKKIPERISEPDRLWLTLAGYNVGFGHLEDARILTQRGGGGPDKWSDVKKFLPLLSQKKYYKTVKHGYARGREPVSYVDNIRSYYDLLIWENRSQETTPAAGTEVLTTTPAAL
jgi:membrane-bound lytic murein transglycosylase F